MSLPSEIIATELASLPERKQGFVLQALLITLWHREAALVLLDLLGNPAELDHDQTKISAIHKVSESEAEGLFDILVEKEANINYSRDRNEPDFLTVAIQYGHLSMAKGLVNTPIMIHRIPMQYGAKKGALTTALINSSIEGLSLLLEEHSQYFFEPNFPESGSELRRALRSAIKQNHQSCARRLLGWAIGKDSHMLPSNICNIPR
ncbi:hypothetical protein WAI453_010931 [Rhynchosporium graminicola]